MSVGIPGLFARLRALWRSLARPAELDRQMDDEMRFHIEMQAERLAREQQRSRTNHDIVALVGTRP